MFKFIVDSTFCLDKDFITKYDIKVVNMILNLGDVVYDEGEQSTWGELYKKMEETKEFPKTSQPGPLSFMNAIQEILQEDENANIIILTLSSKLSGTYNSALLAKSNFPDASIEVIDTLMGTVLNKIVMRKVVNMSSLDEIKQYITQFREYSIVRILPEDIVYLKRGGRLNTASYLVANMLNIKPIISLQDGELDLVKKTVGIKSAINELVQIAKGFNRPYVHVAKVGNSKILPMLKRELEKENIAIKEELEIDPVIGCHVGIGGIAMARLLD